MSDEISLSDLLRRTADDLVAQFSEFELVHDWPALTRLGSGTLWIDLGRARTHHNGVLVEPLQIAAWLCFWLRESLAGAGLSKTDTQDAALTAVLTVQHYSGQRKPNTDWAGAPSKFVGCTAEVRCRLAVNDVVAEAKKTETMEWPEPSAA